VTDEEIERRLRAGVPSLSALRTELDINYYRIQAVAKRIEHELPRCGCGALPFHIGACTARQSKMVATKAVQRVGLPTAPDVSPVAVIDEQIRAGLRANRGLVEIAKRLHIGVAHVTAIARDMPDLGPCACGQPRFHRGFCTPSDAIDARGLRRVVRGLALVDDAPDVEIATYLCARIALGRKVRSRISAEDSPERAWERNLLASGIVDADGDIVLAYLPRRGRLNMLILAAKGALRMGTEDQRPRLDWLTKKTGAEP